MRYGGPDERPPVTSASETAVSSAPPRIAWGVISVCFFLSGATGLIYQVIWLRMLGLQFGHTVYAITTVLAAFMAGLALGSLVFARRAPRLRDPVRAYGWLEIGIGLYCVVIPELFALVSHAYLALHRALGFSYDAFSLVQFLLISAVLVVPTALMGGTLPVLTQGLMGGGAALGRTVGSLYAINTFGAVTGVALAGYVLLPAFGNRVTLTMAAVGNLLVGTVAILYSRRRRAAPPPEPAAAATSPWRALGSGAWLIAAALGVSGAVSMVYEVGWTRALALMIGSSTYAFSAMLLAVLVGIAVGSALYSRLRGSRGRTPTEFGALQAGIGVAVGAAVLVYTRIPDLVIALLSWSGAPLFVNFVQFGISAIALLLGTLVIGATFPCAIAVVARVSRPGEDVGYLYAVNTLGAIVGAVVAGFVLVPAVGVQRAIEVGIAVNLLLAALLFAADRGAAGARRAALAAGALVACGAIALIPRWDQLVMSSGPAVYARTFDVKTARALMAGHELLYYRDGRSGTVTVTKIGGDVILRVNGKIDASTGGDMSTQLMSGHLPMLLHRNPRDVLIIGLGSGITAGAVTRHAAERIDVVEIERSVVETAKFFAHVHGNALADPRVRTVVADGRNFLLTTPRRYDVIISEPSNPWIGGLASLFSQEFFALARERLRPGGMMLQWVQTYGLHADDLRMVVNTFRSAFPSVTVWSSLRADILLVGQREPEGIDLLRVKARVESREGIRKDLERLRLRSWPAVLGYFVLDAEDTRRFAEGSPLNTDDRLQLEFSAPRSLYQPGTVDSNWTLLQRSRTRGLPVTAASRDQLDQAEVQYWIGIGHLMMLDWKGGFAAFERALQLQPDHALAAVGGAEAALRLGRPDVAFRLATQALEKIPEHGGARSVAARAGQTLRQLDGLARGVPR